MPSEPTLFDDEGGTGPDHGSTRRATVPHDDAAPASTPRPRSPNFLVRRAIVVGGVVAVLVAASIVIGRMIGAGAEDTSTGAIDADWNRIVLVDDRSGRVVVDGADGDEVARIDTGVRTPTSSAVVGSTLVVAGADDVSVIDLNDPDGAERFELGVDALVGPTGSALTMIAPQADNSRALLVHGPSGDVIDTDTFATVVGARYEFASSRSSPSGRDVLVTDSGNFQSVLFSFDRAEPSFFPGLALAVDADFVVTAQNVGSDATLNVFDHDGTQVATGRTSSVRAGMLAGSTVVLVTAEGAVAAMSTSSGEISDGPQLDIGTVDSGAVTTSGDRLVITGATGTAVVDEGASVIATYDGQRLAEAERAPAGSSCIALTTVDDGPEPQLAVVDVSDGAVLVESNGGTQPPLADASGCTIVVTTAVGFDVLSGDGARQFRTDDSVLALSLDGAAAAAERDGRVVLIGVGPDDEPSDEPTDLGPSGRTVHFTQS